MQNVPDFLSLRYHRQLASCGVCRLVAVTVFLAIVAIEIAILLPSYRNERDRLIDELGARATAFAEGARVGVPRMDGATLPSGVLEVSLRDPDGSSGPVFGRVDGVATALPLPPVLLSDGSVMHAMVDRGLLGERLLAFTLRIAGLIVLIAAFATVAAMLVMGHTVLSPLLLIERALTAAARSPDRTEFEPLSLPRRGELRNVAETVNLLFAELTHFNRIEQARKDHTDPLTGLHNRTGVLAVLAMGEQEQPGSAERRRGWTLFLLNVDGFARVNARHGHDEGDRILKTLATRLAEAAGNEEIAARIVGDEFLLASRDVRTPAEAAAMAARLVAEMSMPIDVEGQEVTLSVSCGISPTERAPVDEGRLQALRMVLRRAKSDGGGRVRFLDAELDALAKRRRRLERALRGAVERGEIHVVYQPKVSLRTGELVGAEALARWRLREQEEVSPAEFVPICEDIGMIEDLTRTVLHRVLADCAAWRDGGLHPPRIAVNVSASQFRDPGLVDFIADSLAAARTPRDALEIEITEGAFIGDMEHAVAQLRKLRAIGVTTAIDDFGTGYSSLAYLRHLPIATLKIDRAFVSEIAKDEGAKRIADTIVALGSRLGVETVAEGVETQVQADMLRAAGCDVAQGWLFSRPLSASVFAERLAVAHSARLASV